MHRFVPFLLAGLKIDSFIQFFTVKINSHNSGHVNVQEVNNMARKPRPTKGSRDETIPGERSSNPMGVSPDHEFSIEPLSKGAAAAKKKNTK